MAATSVTIELPVPPERVWAVVTDLPRLGEWVTTHKDFPSPPPGTVAKGTSFEQEMTLAGASMTIHWTAERVEAPRELVWHGDGPVGSTATTRYRLEDIGGGTRFIFDTEYELPGGPLGRVAGAAAKGHGESEARASLERLRTLCEDGKA
jgi:uncharacterized protein YndB with AHSA1/START domain